VKNCGKRENYDKFQKLKLENNNFLKIDENKIYFKNLN